MKKNTQTDYTTGTPWLACDLEGTVTAETEASLKDHFALAVNKDKILEMEIPEGYSSCGTMTDLTLQNVEDTKKMFLGKAPESHDAKLAYDLFHLMMDWDSRNAQGAAPLKKITDSIEAVGSIDELNAWFLETPPGEQLVLPWEAVTGGDFKDSTKNMIMVASGSLLLKDSAEYIKLTDYGKIKKEALTELAQKMLVKLGYTEDEAKQKIENCLAFEKMMAPLIPSDEEIHQPDFLAGAYNLLSYDDLKKMEGRVPVLEKLEKDGFPQAKEYVVAMPDYLPKLNEFYTDENIGLIRDYLIVNSAVKTAAYLDRECYELDTACNNAVSGASGMLPDEDAFAPAVAEALEWPVGRLYAETYLKQEDKDRIRGLIESMVEAYRGIISEAGFLSDETKAKALEKLDSMGIEVLYPDSWEKYECPELNFRSKEEGGTLWEALSAISDYELAKSVKDYSGPVDKAKWEMPPCVVNCGYLPTNNTVYILGGFTQGAIYNSGMSDEEMMGTLGWVVGHEISHAFDSKGSQFDKDGNMNDWWTDEDKKAFLKRNEKMEAYYNKMHPWEGQDFHGSIMTGEACADMGGMKVLLRIASEKKDFDYDKLFRSLAVAWLEKGTLQNAYHQINDVHPMGYLRVNCTLQQFDEFIDFYGIKKGDGMYLAPEDRVVIW